MPAAVESVVVVTDAPLPAALPPASFPMAERVEGPEGRVVLVVCTSLGAAVGLIRRALDRGHHASLFAEEAEARMFAEAVVAGRASWADEEP